MEEFDLDEVINALREEEEPELRLERRHVRPVQLELVRTVRGQAAVDDVAVRVVEQFVEVPRAAHVAARAAATLRV